ncbi:MAG: Maf family protein [Planctomycetota bacterium]|nr:Maf family protein [Planctomycetota bacterium]
MPKSRITDVPSDVLQGLHVVLASQSPRRRELLKLIVAEANIEVRPPREDREISFEGLVDWSVIEQRLILNARTKCENVHSPTRPDVCGPCITLAADTVIVAQEAGERLIVLEKPPEPNWQATVRRWFEEYLIGKTHWALTGICIASGEHRCERLVRTEVAFRQDGHRWLEWYIETEEPRGKAGGYGLQGAGDIFVSRVEGSISNVVGLPLHDVAEVLASLSIE